MASTYSTNLGIELMGTGDQSGTWGATTNTNLGTLLEQAIAGYSTQAVTDSGTATVLTIANGASSTGRNAVIALTGALTAARVVEVPAKTKSYIFYNATTGGFAVTVKVTGQTGVSVPNGTKAIVYCDGTDVRNVLSNITVDSSGNVGIGTTAGTTTVASGLAINNATAANYPGLEIQTAGVTRMYLNANNAVSYIASVGTNPLVTYTNSAERMRIDSSSNVGIGTTSPGYTLDVRATTGAISATSNTGTNYAKLQCNNSGGSYQFGIDNSAGTNFGSGTAYSRVIWNDSSTAPTILYTSSTERMRIDSSGNVGIGTNSPGAKLDVQLATNATARIKASSSGYALFDIDAASSNQPILRFLAAATESARIFSPINESANQLAFATGSAATERMRIDSSGRLLVNITAPLYRNEEKFAVYGAATFKSNASGLPPVNVLADPGSAGYLILFYNNGGTSGVGYINTDGSTTSYNTSSDYRLKENAVPITAGLATLNLLKPVAYDWINSKLRGEGFIAHELQEVIPLAVTGEKDAVDDDGNIKPQGVDYSKIVVHLVAAIQELSAKVTALESK